jgi:hypothetical protein
MPARKRSRLTGSARPKLAVFLNGAPVGHVYHSGNRKLALRYDDAWRSRLGAFPLSLSMPTTGAPQPVPSDFELISPSTASGSWASASPRRSIV